MIASSSTPKTKTARHIRDIPPSAYRLPGDGRKWRAVCERRRSLTVQLSSHADSDGSSVYVGRSRLANSLGLSIREVGYLLADLATLKFIRDDGWHGQTRRRLLDLNAIFQVSEGGQSRSAVSGIRAGEHGQNRAGAEHGQNRGPGQNSVGVGQNSSGRRPSIVDLPKSKTPLPPFSRGAPLTVRDRRHLNQEICRLMENPAVQLAEAVETACAELLIPLEQAWAVVDACGLGEARKKRAQRATA